VLPRLIYKHYYVSLYDVQYGPHVFGTNHMLHTGGRKTMYAKSRYMYKIPVCFPRHLMSKDNTPVVIERKTAREKKLL